jgi:hypothetical protein
MTERHLLNLAFLPVFLIVFLIGCLRAYFTRSKSEAGREQAGDNDRDPN